MFGKTNSTLTERDVLDALKGVAQVGPFLGVPAPSGHAGEGAHGDA